MAPSGPLILPFLRRGSLSGTAAEIAWAEGAEEVKGVDAGGVGVGEDEPHCVGAHGGHLLEGDAGSGLIDEFPPRTAVALATGAGAEAPQILGGKGTQVAIIPGKGQMGAVLSNVKRGGSGARTHGNSRRMGGQGRENRANWQGRVGGGEIRCPVCCNGALWRGVADR